MKPIIPPVPVDILKSELTSDKFIRITNNGANELYIVTWQDSPNILKEIGRLREQSFRDAGGGTGKDCDLDEFDISKMPYKQLIVWNPEEEEITGGYRFIKCGDSFDEHGRPFLATSELFEFSEKFKRDYMPYTIELGRSFVQTKYQPSAENRIGLYSLDNLWDGLGAMMVDNPDIKYFWGKVTMYSHFNQEARDMILFFMNYYFPDKDKLAWPIKPLPVTHDMNAFGKLLEGLPYKEGHKILNRNVRELGENIPPLLNSYMNVSPTMKTFGTALNDHFGDVEETGILVTMADIYETKKARHVNTYVTRVL